LEKLDKEAEMTTFKEAYQKEDKDQSTVKFTATDIENRMNVDIPCHARNLAFEFSHSSRLVCRYLYNMWGSELKQNSHTICYVYHPVKGRPNYHIVMSRFMQDNASAELSTHFGKRVIFCTIEEYKKGIADKDKKKLTAEQLKQLRERHVI
jgi:hypothetical protein